MRLTALALVRSGIGLSLGALYALTVAEWITISGLHPSTTLELVVLGLLVLRLGLYFSIQALRRMRYPLVIILFGSDVYVVLAAVIAFDLTGAQAYANFGRLYVSGWLGSSPIVYPALAVFFLHRAVERRASLSYVLPSAAGSFGLLSLLCAAMVGGVGTGGLGGVASQLLGALRGTTDSLAPVPLLPYAACLLFASLVVYSVLGRDEGRGGWVAPLVFAVSGVLLVLSWATVIGPKGALWLTMGLPAAAVVGAVWLITRE